MLAMLLRLLYDYIVTTKSLLSVHKEAKHISANIHRQRCRQLDRYSLGARQTKYC